MDSLRPAGLRGTSRYLTALPEVDNPAPACSSESPAARTRGRKGKKEAGLAAVHPDLLAVGQHRLLEPDDLLAVGELIADARDHVAGLDRRLGPAVRLHPVDGGTTDQPLLDPAVNGAHLDGNHR